MPTVIDQFYALGSSIEGAFRTEELSGSLLLSEVRKIVFHFEDKFSRFRTHSELSRLNRNAGSSFPVSEEMLDLFLATRRVWERTDHFVDPTVGNAVIAAGYDASFDDLEPNNGRPAQTRERPSVSFGDIVIDRARSTVMFPKGSTLDFGGIGKGYLLDQLDPLIRRYTGDYWLSLGGDIMVSGTDDEGVSWAVGIQDPESHERDIAMLNPRPGRWGIATSGTTKRRGVRNGNPWHHLIDPRIGEPAHTDVVAATVVAPSAFEADAMAKTILLMGSHKGLSWAKRQRGIEALIITDSHRIMSLPGTQSIVTLL